MSLEVVYLAPIQTWIYTRHGGRLMYCPCNPLPKTNEWMIVCCDVMWDQMKTIVVVAGGEIFEKSDLDNYKRLRSA